MHVIFRESQGLEESDTPKDLGQSPGDLVVLSFSDSDLGAFAAAWHLNRAGDPQFPTLRLANIADLRHPLSVDTYIEQTLGQAKAVMIRLIGGQAYWPYGLSQIEIHCRNHGVPLVVLPGDGRPDPTLEQLCTVPKAQAVHLQKLCETGGAEAAANALSVLAGLTGHKAKAGRTSTALPAVGFWTPDHGLSCPFPLPADKPIALITFYRSYLVAGDLAPIKALYEALFAKGFHPAALFAPSLKSPMAAPWVARQVAHMKPAVIVNATAFSGRGSTGSSPLDASNAPVFQVALSTADHAAWGASDRGLSPADLAMHVVLPEVDGRIFAGILSTKETQAKDEVLEFSRQMHQGIPERIRAISNRITAWHDLKSAGKKPAFVMSTYPGKPWNMAHAVGLDAIGSLHAMLDDLNLGTFDQTRLDHMQTVMPWTEYAQALESLPTALQQDLQDAWGDPKDDICATKDGLRLPLMQTDKAIIALQPERGTPELRGDEYHDLSRTPRHSYVAFYLWMQRHARALVHIGAHGTLEWLPGKSVALSNACWPEALTGHLPVIYPFIVNDPGEAAQAKRRIGAVTLGHIPPPLKPSETPERFVRLEQLLDEFSNADGLDPKRRDRLQGDIRAEAQAIGVETDLGLDTATCSLEAITRIDRFVCDIKESQFGDGLHIWGRTPQGQPPFDAAQSVAAERASLAQALNGARVQSGPSGSPYRGRQDVLPTGRNLYAVDPRSVPTRAAYAQGKTLADELIRRHLQDKGDWPKGLVVDLWGSATMRTAGEEFAMALHLLGVKPVWDAGSERVSGIEIIPITELDRPRLDVTLRVSGLFRDVFPTLTALYAQAIRALAQRDEAADWNPYVGTAAPRVFGPAPGQFGVNVAPHLNDYTPEARAAAGQAWIAASSWALDGDKADQDAKAIIQHVQNADTFVHLQDMPETDILLSEDYASHEAGFVAAQMALGGAGQAYHVDATNPDASKARSLTEEVARVVMARATQPGWIQGMQRHGFRGAAEIAATLDNMAAFSHLADAVPAHLFDAYFEVTLGDDAVAVFLKDANPGAYRAMIDRFKALHDAGLWNTRRNSILAELEGL
ncbi:MAG: cobaltochelatase subunit CobN [Planktomarina sp.]